MKEDIAIKVTGLGKKYTIGKEKDGSLRSTLSGMFKSAAAKGNDFWALKDVNFEIKKGEVVGIIGKNGAGKSTLLKVLSQITKPTEGRIEINGRVASLLEVGTGFHPELTGRENIFLNGTILGMTRKEVKAKFDEIVEFSGVQKFIDTPVKHYSSGMYVRLAFAVAAHLEPEILIIDEVLAVGDAEFQKKCLGKMEDVAKEGRTVIFVSHNMSAVKELCSKGIKLINGQLHEEGQIDEIIENYIQDGIIIKKEYVINEEQRTRTTNQIQFEKVILNQEVYSSNSCFEIGVTLKRKTQALNATQLSISVHIADLFNNQIYHINNKFIKHDNITYSNQSVYTFRISPLKLKSGQYQVWLWLANNSIELEFIDQGINFIVNSDNVYGYMKSEEISGVVQPSFTFKTITESKNNQ
ncbi:MAG: ABC transporter ATP-binding protein [Lishizhenia sp.]